MFALNKDHRQGLVHKLQQTIDEIEIQKGCIEHAKSEDGVFHWHEIELFLLEKRKELIEKAIIENEIDW